MKNEEEEEAMNVCSCWKDTCEGSMRAEALCISLSINYRERKQSLCDS